MDNFVYHSPTKVFFGRGMENNVGDIIKGYGWNKILLHYGGGSIKKIGLYDRVLESLSKNGIEYVELGGVEPNPKIDLVRHGINICKKNGVEFVLAVGGGSVIDSSKAIAMGAKLDFDVWDMFTKNKELDDALPVGSILTISAAGSEVSPESVITNPEGKLKRGFGSEHLWPVFAIMNPELTFTVSKYQTACGIVDIIMHTLERYFTNTKYVDLIDNIAEGLVRSVISAGKKAIQNPRDYEARATLMWASSLSHNGLTGTGRQADWATHQIEHELSGMYDFIAHGVGLSMLFPAWCKYVYKHDIERFCRYATEIWDCKLDEENPEKTAFEGIKRTEEYFHSLGMPIRLSEVGIDNRDFDVMAEKCVFHGKRTIGSFVQLDKEDIIKILNLAL